MATSENAVKQSVSASNHAAKASAGLGHEAMATSENAVK